MASSASEAAVGGSGRSAGATPAMGPGKSTLVQGAAAPAPTFKSVLASVAQKTDALARAIATLNYFDAWSASLDLQRAITYAEGQLQMVNAAERAAAAGELQVLAEAAQEQIARAPSPSKAAVQEVTSAKDRHAARPRWDAEKRAWLAVHGGSAGTRSAGTSAAEPAPGSTVTRSGSSTDAGASGAAPSHDVAAGSASSHATDHGAGHAPVAAARASAPGSGAVSSQAQRAPAGAAPPDLGNYDSPIGKRVLVLRTWDDTAIAARRVELQGRLSRTTDPKARDELLTEYQAIEWVAHERGLALPKDAGEEAAPQAYSGGKPIKYWVPETAQGTRAMLEREMAAGSGYESAREHAQLRIGYGTLPQSETNNDKRLIGDQQIALMDHDAAAFRGAFQIEAKQTALSMLDASTAAIDSALRSYGIASGSFRLTDAAHKVARDPTVLDAEVDKWVALSSRLDDNRAAYAAGHGKREDLAREAKQLRDLQDSIAALAAEQLRLMKLQQAEHPEHPGMPRPAKQPDWRAFEARSAQLRPMQGSAPQPQNPFAQRSAPAAEAPEHQLEFVRGALRARQAQFQAAWIQAERQHPVLAAYRGTKSPDASSLADLGTDEAMTRSIVHHVLPKLGHIYRTKAALLGSWGTLDPLQLAPAVELTKQRMFVAQGSTRNRVVHDMVVQAHDKSGLAQWALEAVMIGLTLVTLVPTAGASAAAGLALTGLAYDLYMGMGEYEDFQVMSAAADTDLDKLRSLSDLEPSLTPLLTRIVSAGINLTVAAGLFKRAVVLRRMAMSGKVDPDALVELNKAGEAAGVKNLGDEAIGGMRPVVGSEVAPKQEIQRLLDEIERRAGGLRRPALNTLEPEEIARLQEEFASLGGDPAILRFNKGAQTGFVDQTGHINVRGDVNPIEGAHHPRSAMSSKAVLGHELGHHAHRGTRLPIGAWNDEFRASYWAAKNLPNLSDEDRIYLVLDAMERAREAGVSFQPNALMRKILYGY